ncbi:MAG: hypothetical protein WA628_12125, partial [Terriglobales bacterium]
MKRVRSRRIGRPRQPAQKRPRVRRKDLPTIKLPGQSRGGGGKTKLTNHRAAVILHAISCGCYRETAAQLAGVTPETLCHWMRWEREPYKTFQRLVRRAEADLEARMVTALTSQVHVRPELALAILERKFPDRWSKAVIVAGPPAVNLNLGQMLTRVIEKIRARRDADGERPQSTVIESRAITDGRPHDPRPPRLPLPVVESTEPVVPITEFVVAHDPSRRRGIGTVTRLG